MGAFYTGCTVVNPVARTRSVRAAKLLVDTGSGCTWVPTRTLTRVGTEVFARAPHSVGMGMLAPTRGSQPSVDEQRNTKRIRQDAHRGMRPVRR